MPTTSSHAGGAGNGRQQLYPVQISLTATSPFSLHAHQAAILYSLLSHAGGLGSGAAPAMPDGVLLDAPEQSRMYYTTGERFNFGLTLVANSPAGARHLLQVLQQGLATIGSTGTPARQGLHGNFAVTQVHSLVSGQPITAGGSDAVIPAIPEAILDEETKLLAGLREITLRFHAPLRCERPRALRTEGATCFDEHLFLPEVFLNRARRRLQELGLCHEMRDVPGDHLELLENRLVWLDVSYGPKATRKAVGGAVGRIVLRLRSPELARILVLAQYARVGEKTRWGFGAFRIEELGPRRYCCDRSTSLLQLALSSPAVDRVAEQHGLESGRMRGLVPEVLSGRYQPRSPQRFILPAAGADGDPRVLSVPRDEDRALQTAVLRQVAPALDLFFEESSLAYRQGLGRQRAAQRLGDAYRSGFRWAVRSDIHRFFDSINHAVLRERLDAYLADDQLVRLIMQWVESGAPRRGLGIPTGSPLSPLLSNLFLDRFDEAIHDAGGCLVRYADDFLILLKLRDDAQRFLDLAREAAIQLKLHLNADKTRFVDLSQPFEFLGYRFDRKDTWELTTNQTLRHVDDLG